MGIRRAHRGVGARQRGSWRRRLLGRLRPFCMAASAVQPISPEVVGHLLKAGSELFLAFRSAIDGRADDLAGGAPAAPVRLEKIDVG